MSFSHGELFIKSPFEEIDDLLELAVDKGWYDRGAVTADTTAAHVSFDFEPDCATGTREPKAEQVRAALVGPWDEGAVVTLIGDKDDDEEIMVRYKGKLGPGFHRFIEQLVDLRTPDAGPTA